MRYKFIIIVFLLGFRGFSQYGTYQKRQQPMSPLNTELIGKTMQRLEDREKRKECISLINYAIENSSVKETFIPSNSTAIAKSYLLKLEDVYFAYIIFTSSGLGYLYHTNKELWDNYVSMAAYSAGKSFNEYIYPYKVCDY
jgi:hypothetical protein